MAWRTSARYRTRIDARLALVSDELASGQRVGPYRLIYRLEERGTGPVWVAQRAAAAGFEHVVALELLRAAEVTSQSALGFFHEAHASAALQHAAIVPTIDVGRSGDTLYVATDLVRGPSLAALLRRVAARNRSLTPAMVAYLGERLASALDHAYERAEVDGHRLRLVHREVSPRNVLIDEGGRVMLSGSGVALTAIHDHEWRIGSVRGGSRDMAPEQVSGGALDTRTDLVALGICLYEAACTRRVFDRKHEVEGMAAVIADEPESLTTVIEGFPEPLWRVIERALAKTPEDRFQSGAELSRALAEANETLPGAATAARDLAALIAEVFPAGSFDVEAHVTEALSRVSTHEEPAEPTRVAEPDRTAAGPPLGGPTATVRSAGEGLAPGKLFDERFVLERPLGRGGHATVWLARRGEHRVALKVLHPATQQDRILLERFEREGATLMELRHPAIVRVLEHSAEREHVYLVLEYVEGASLAAVLGTQLERATYVDHFRVLSWAQDIAAALDHAHERGVVHRDIKPQNVLIGADGRARVADFGIARILDSETLEATTLGRTVGSLMYMAPEQVRGEHVDRAADVFGLATILFETLTLRRAWAVDSAGRRARAVAGSLAAGPNAPQSIYQRMMTEPPPRATDERSDLPPGVDLVLARGMARDARERYASAGELVAALARALESHTSVDRSAVDALRAAGARRGRRVILAAGALVALASVAGSVTLSSEESRQLMPVPAAVGVAEPTRAEVTVPTRAEVTEPAPVRAEPVEPVEPVELVVSSGVDHARPVVDRPRLRPDAGPARRVASVERPAVDAQPAPSRWRVRLSQFAGDPEFVAELSADLTRAARSLADSERRTRVERLCKAAELTGDVELLARAIDELEGSTR